MKKIIAICVCAVLLVAAFFIIDANKSRQDEKIPSGIFFPSADGEKNSSLEQSGSDADASSDGDDSSSLEESSEADGETETEEVTYKKAEVLRVIEFTSVVSSGDEVILSLSGMPTTKYDIYVYYSSKPSTDASLQPKYSDGDGDITWKWVVPSAVKSGTKKIEIIGGGEILTLYIEII